MALVPLMSENQPLFNLLKCVQKLWLGQAGRRPRGELVERYQGKALRGRMGRGQQSGAGDLVALNRALRGAVTDQLAAFLEDWFPQGGSEAEINESGNFGVEHHPSPRCSLSGVELLSRRDCLVIHAPPDSLASLRDAWLESEGMGVDGVLLTGGDPDQMDGPLRLSNPSLMSSWRAFHERRAVLTLVSREELARRQSSPRGM